MPHTRRAVVWFRRDLRLHDHPALAAAIERSDEVAPLFVLDDALVTGRWPSPNRLAFMLDSLRSLDADLRARGSRLHVRRGQPASAVAAFARECGAADVFVSRDYSRYARRRDSSVSAALNRDGMTFHARPGTLVHEPEAVRSGSGEPYAVYTPFRRRWEALARRNVVDAPGSLATVEGLASDAIPTVRDLGFTAPTASLVPAGEPAARERLDRWCEGPGVDAYRDRRNMLAVEGTSRLSQDLRWGLLSPLEVITRCEGADGGRAAFIGEIAWREFYYHVLWHHPRVTREPFQRQFAHLRHSHDGEHIAAWKEGLTGYPVVDAAMRQLLTTGWMHNRARMIVASFLTKDLLVDWRVGEAHFMAHLVDGDVASNNGGWQWAASTGTDAQPYFRIFNPTKQGETFDPAGTFVRRWLPALMHVPDAYVHAPWRMPEDVQRASGCIIGRDYPAPIVDHADARDRALTAYAEARSTARSG